ncbi:MAG: hypothetical protein JXA11_12550 [Phycisphaerae bacterium]|nr:hypothetical protein [Phycisphaerae bacterium]
MTIRVWSGFLCLGIVLAGGTATGRADDPEAVFREKYGPAITKVRSTPTPTDDLDLARTLLKDAPAQPAPSAAVEYQNAYDLAKDSPNGYDLAVEAMERLGQLDPNQAERCLSHIFLLRKKQYDSATGRVRLELGRDTIDVLLELARQKIRQGRQPEAEMYLREAMTIAQSIHSPRRRRIQERLETLPRAMKAAQNRQKLQVALHEHPDDADARAELVLLHLVRFDDPAAASADLAPDLNETLRSYVPLLRRDPDTLPPEVAEEMACWLAGLAKKAPVDRQTALLIRARKFYDRVLSGFKTDDPRRKRAADQYRTLQQRLASLGAVVGGRTWSRNYTNLGFVAPAGVNHSIQKAREYLFGLQQADGSWRPDRPNPMGLDRVGATALATYALLQSGLSAGDPRFRRTLIYLQEEETNNTQSLSLRCCVWALCRNELGRRYYRFLANDAETLYRASGNGGFEAVADTSRPARRGDAFYTQWGVLALATAAEQEVVVPRTFWSRNRTWWLRCQNEDGGWGRRAGRLSRPFYSAAGAVSLLIDLEQSGRSRAEALDDRVVKIALAWVDQNFDRREQPDRPLFFFNLARLGAARGEAKIGAKNWYAWCARELLHTQDDDGAWRPGRESILASTALNLLTLSFAQGGR